MLSPLSLSLSCSASHSLTPHILFSFLILTAPFLSPVHSLASSFSDFLIPFRLTCCIRIPAFSVLPDYFLQNIPTNVILTQSSLQNAWLYMGSSGWHILGTICLAQPASTTFVFPRRSPTRSLIRGVVSSQWTCGRRQRLCGQVCKLSKWNPLIRSSRSRMIRSRAVKAQSPTTGQAFVLSIAVRYSCSPVWNLTEMVVVAEQASRSTSH